MQHTSLKLRSRLPAPRAIFALFDRVPGLRSVIAPLRRNPKINPAERHRLENEPLTRRHQREQFLLDRRYRALARLAVRERRSLKAGVRRECGIHAAEFLREKTAHVLDLNKLDITLPRDNLTRSLSGRSTRKKTAGKDGRQGLANVAAGRTIGPKGAA